MSKDNDKKEDTAGALALICLMPIMIPLSVAVRAFMVSKLWAWLAVPIFAIKAITFWQAMGVSILVSYLTHQSAPSSKKSGWEVIGNWIFMLTIGNGVVLLVAWIVKGNL